MGIAVTASKVEVALDAYYQRLEDWTPEGWDSPLSERMGRDAAEAVRLQFSSRSPTFAVLSDTEHQPVVDDMPSELTEAAETCENVLPMKRSVYYRS